MRLEGKVAIITGGASGIGKATAMRFVREGSRVAIIGNDRTEVLRAAEEIGEVGNVVIPFVGDVVDEHFIKMAIQQTYQKFGKITTIVNNAGIMENCPIEEETIERWDNHMNINVRGMMLSCKHAFPYLKQGAGGSIVNVSSIMGFTSAVASVSYSASKSAILGLTRAIAMDGAPFQIRANCVCPGTIDTPMYRRYIDQLADPQEAHSKFGLKFPLGRVGTAEDVANLILFLSSDEAAYITGADYIIDGGYMIKGTND